MASSPSNQPIRSISLPSRPHPLVPQIDEHLWRLNLIDSEVEDTVSSTSESQISSLGHKLSNLKELYDCLDNFILLPQNQQKLVQFSNVKRVDELIDGSLRLLDVCGNVKDVLSQVKEHTQEIQSSLRRRCSGELSIGGEVYAYMNMRKKSKLICKKCLKNVKGMVKKFKFNSEEYEGNNAVIEVLIKVERVTATIFESLLELILVSGSKSQSYKRSAGLSIIMCKLIMYQNSRNETEELFDNEFEDADSSLSSLMGAQRKRVWINGLQGEKLRGKMVRLESSVQDLDEVLEGLFRCLVRSRATLLNIISQ
ncbi:hypothetical protein RND81_09G141500 [Saponaria officinalis]|uniref:DUF241 domain protein n=1 Tax=Saponaria officinalis TaxID=3572 RepID=A0AAW1IMK5_SAPOF